MAKRKRSEIRLHPPQTLSKHERDAREAENTKRLGKLPPEVWEKIFDELKSNDLFPLALSCKYFRQKQKELLARARQNGPGRREPRFTLETTLVLEPEKGQPASSDYVRFCSKEKVRFAEENEEQRKAEYVRRLAAFHGHLPLLQELLAGLKKLDCGITANAARGGQLETLQWLRTHENVCLCPGIFASACEGGHMEIIRWLRKEGFPWDVHACTYAARYGHLEVLKWLRSEGCPWNEEACQSAAMGGHLEVLKWLRKEGCPWDAHACSFAAEGGHLEVLKWLRKEGCPWNENACAGAASGGHLEMLKWLRSEGCPWNENACMLAASCGYREVLQWLLNGESIYDFRPKRYPNPDKGGHFEVLKWLRSEGCPWDEWTCAGAASGGNLEMVKWLRSEGCPWDEGTSAAAVGGGNLDVLEWAINNGCDCAGWMTRMVDC